MEQGANWLRVIGATGGRLDQTLSNIYLLALPALEGCDVQLLAGKQAIWLAREGVTEIHGAADDTLSLIPLNGTVRGVSRNGRPLDQVLQGVTRELWVEVVEELARVEDLDLIEKVGQKRALEPGVVRHQGIACQPLF